MKEQTVKSRAALLAVLSTGLLVGSIVLSSCGGAPTRTALAPTATVAATTTYLPPIVVTNTPTPLPPTPKPTPTRIPMATSTPKPLPPPPPGPAPIGGVPQIGGQLILVSLAQQWLWAYQNRHLVYDMPVTTGRPELPTPDGTYHVQFKETNVTFYSPWPPGSPFYYPPEHINYAMYFAYDGYYLHDAPWKSDFGPGTNYPHTAPDGSQETGSHGCVEMPTHAAAWLYSWTYDGATVRIYGTAPTGPAPTPTPQPSPTSQPPTPTPTATSAPPTPTPTDTPKPSPTATP
ncbi:MAG: hypothetical protein OJF49_001916 [Ktedonobacterales bacterium]|jgi:lipoprotein-anchoring transpeptidase ErfK/SrfK|nr:MAG: hypothetical protein OJF49_001916 [Ktedonobacterales bacterium]